MFTSLRLHLSSGPPAAIQRGLSPRPRRRDTVEATLELTHERVDDVPLLLGFLIQLKLPEILDRHFPDHPLHQGLSNGWLATVWIAYILSRADHRKAPVQAWSQQLHHTLEATIGQDIRPVEFSDDRLTLLLKRLGVPDDWEALEVDLWHTHCDVYALPVERVRLDATTSCGYHTITDDGLMQLGHSKEFRHNKLSDLRPGLLRWHICRTPQCSPSRRSTPALNRCSMSEHAGSGLPPKPGRSGVAGSPGSPRPPGSLG